MYNTYEAIETAIGRFNKRTYNAGLDFRVVKNDEDSVEIEASFDFMQYVNVEIDCIKVIYTNIETKEYWSDAWNDDQMKILSQKDLDEIIDFKDYIEAEEGKQYFGIVFNINGFINYYTSGLAICEALKIHWKHPKYED